MPSTTAQRRRDENLLRLATRTARFGSWEISGQTRQVSMSEGARMMLGITDNADINEVLRHLCPEDEQRRINALIEQCLVKGTAFDVDIIIVTTSGAQLTVRTAGEAQRAPDGRIVGARGALWNISESVADRARERILEARLSVTLGFISHGICFLDNQNHVTYANPGALELMRVGSEEAQSTSMRNIFPEAVETGFTDAFDRARETREQVTHRAYSPRRNLWFETTACPTDDGLVVFLRDVTDEERAHDTAQQTREQLAAQAALLDTARDAMIVRHIDGRVAYWNHAAEELYGWSSDEAVGQPITMLIDTDADARAAALAEVMSVGYFAGELAQRTRDGRTVIVDCRWQLLTDDGGAPRSIFSINTDITEYRRQQEAHLRAQRMESLGTLAGGISHDLNNVLTPILISTQLLTLDEADAGRREMLATIESAVKRGAEMISQVLSFARGVEGRRIVVDVDLLIDDLVALSRTLIPDGIVIDVQRQETSVATMGDPTQLLQVLVNLVTNARDAMPQGGHLHISAARLDIGDEYSSVTDPAAPGSYVAITIEDDGHGISAEMVSRVFEPFFTTKAVGKGTGLGLATSSAIIRSHGGFMLVDSEPEHGARFTVGLPISTQRVAVSTQESKGPPPLPGGKGECVLVIDDDESIRRVTSRTLEAHGYRTVVASNGLRGIELIEHGAERIDLVLTDMMMPVMDGAATSAYLEEHHPGIPIIGASGLNSGANSTRSVGMGISRLLAKPYTTSVLLTTVRDTLLEHRSRAEEAR